MFLFRIQALCINRSPELLLIVPHHEEEEPILDIQPDDIDGDGYNATNTDDALIQP